MFERTSAKCYILLSTLNMTDNVYNILQVLLKKRADYVISTINGSKSISNKICYNLLSITSSYDENHNIKLLKY